jgi:hypothetical protein
LSATFLAPFLIPMFFYVITGRVFKSKPASASTDSGSAALPSTGGTVTP